MQCPPEAFDTQLIIHPHKTLREIDGVDTTGK